MKRRIIIQNRPDDYMAFLKGNREIWGCGRTYDEAVGNLIRSHKELFDIDIVIDGGICD